MLLIGTVLGWVGHKRQLSTRKEVAFEALLKVHTENGWSYFDKDQTSLIRLTRLSLNNTQAPQDWFYVNDDSSTSFPLAMFTPITGHYCFDQFLRFDFSNLKITDKDLVHFTNFKELDSLNLDHTAITDLGMVTLLSLPSLRYLGIGRNEITDQSLATLSSLRSLEELDLWYTEISDDGIQHLAKLHKLKKLNCCGTKVTKSGVDYLQSKLPDCQIWWDENETFQAINKIPTFMGGWNYNPGDSIVAFNLLKRLGKDGLIEAMREYCKVSSSESLNDKGFCQTRLRSVFPILFLPRKLPAAIPQVELLPNWPTTRTASTWPFSVLQLFDGIPFRTRSITGRTGGILGSCEFLIDWAETNCDFIAEPLQPTDNLTDAYERMVAGLDKDPKHRLTRWEKKHLENQLAMLLEDVDDPTQGVRWDVQDQKYVDK